MPVDLYSVEHAEAKAVEEWERQGALETTMLQRNGLKHDKGKPRFDLLPLGPLRELVAVLTFGAEKYAPNNWQKVPELDGREGPPRRRYYSAMMRHATAWYEGEVRDLESGLHHLAHVACCAFFLVWFDLKDGE